MTVSFKLNPVDIAKPLGILSAAEARHQFIYSPSDTPQGPGGVIFLEVIRAG